MEKRVAVFLVASLLIIFGWNYVLEQMGWLPVPPETEEYREADSLPPAAEPSDTGLKLSAGLAPSDPGLSLTAEPDALLGQIAPTEETIEVKTDLYLATFSSRGGVITSWELNRYTSKTQEGPVPVQLMYGEGQFKGPLAITVADDMLSKQISEGLYSVERDFSRLDEGRPVGHLTFTYRDPEARLLVEKQLTFHYDTYLVDVRVRTEGLSEGFDVGLGTNFGIVEWGEGFIGLVGPASMVDGEMKKETPDEQDVRQGSVQWLALQDKYFMGVFLPKDADGAVITNEGDKLASAAVRFRGPQASGLQLYAGPKQYDTLKALNVGLEDTIDFGWFIYGSWDIVRGIAKPLFYVLRFFHEYTHNYGLAIILLTICIKLLFVPLQYKSYKSMKDMQVIQPKVLELQKKLKDDRERLNRELIKLYKDHKVNPVGGCLPMLLQMPVFIALFNILYMTIDLRQAPFVLWISDLSVPDPFFVLPILMGVSMVLQQKIMPTTMDPTQAKMMLMLPVFLTFIFLNFASGLVLYWFTNNVLTIGQQFVTDRYIFKKRTFSSLIGSASEPSPEAHEAKSGTSSGPSPEAKPESPATGQRSSRRERRKKGKGSGASDISPGSESGNGEEPSGREAEATAESASGSGAEGSGAGAAGDGREPSEMDDEGQAGKKDEKDRAVES